MTTYSIQDTIIIRGYGFLKTKRLVPLKNDTFVVKLNDKQLTQYAILTLFQSNKDSKNYIIVCMGRFPLLTHFPVPNHSNQCNSFYRYVLYISYDLNIKLIVIDDSTGAPHSCCKCWTRGLIWQWLEAN